MKKIINENQFMELVQNHEEYAKNSTRRIYFDLAIKLNNEIVEDVILENSVLYNAKSTNTIYNNCFFELCDFSDAQFADCEFIDCNFKGCNFNGTNFRRTKFKDCFFRDCRFKGVSLETFLKDEENGNAIHIINGRVEYVLLSYSDIVVTREGSIGLEKFQDLALFGDNMELKRAYRRFRKIHARFNDEGRDREVTECEKRIRHLEKINASLDITATKLIDEKLELDKALTTLKENYEASIKVGMDLLSEKFELRMEVDALKKKLFECNKSIGVKSNKNNPDTATLKLMPNWDEEELEF